MEEKARRLELKEMRENLWGWRGSRLGDKTKSNEKTKILDDHLERIEEILEKVKREDREMKAVAEAKRRSEERERSRRMDKEKIDRDCKKRKRRE